MSFNYRVALVVAMLVSGLVWVGFGRSDVQAAGNVVVIVNESVAGDVDAATLQSALTGKKKKWDSGGRVSIAVLKKGDIHEEFCSTYVKKTGSQFKSLWKKLVFTGEGRAPKTFATEDELVAYVAKTEGAVGYCSPDTTHDSVKELPL